MSGSMCEWAFLYTLEEQIWSRWDDCFADGSFATAKKWVSGSVIPSGARARRGWWWSTMKAYRWHVTPPARSRAEVKLLEPTLDNIDVQSATAPLVPDRLIYDKGYDSDPSRERLRDEQDIDLVCPYRNGLRVRRRRTGTPCGGTCAD